MLALNWPSSFAVLFVCSQPGGLAQLFSVPPSTQAASRPALQWPPDPQVQELTLLPSMGSCTGPSVIHTLPGACGLRSLELHSPWCTPPWEHQVAGWRGDWTCCCRRIPQSAPEDLFLFEKIVLLNPAASYKEGPVLSLSPPLQLDQDCPGHGPTRPNSQFSPASAQSLRGFTNSSLFSSL